MPVAKRMRAMPSRAAASVAARAAKTVPETATTTGAPSTCRSRTSPFPRRRVSPSMVAPPSRKNGQRGSTTSRTSTSSAAFSTVAVENPARRACRPW